MTTSHAPSSARPRKSGSNRDAADSSHANVKPRSQAASPAYLGGIAGGIAGGAGALGSPAFLQRKPGNMVQRLPQDPFPTVEDEEETLQLQRLPQDPTATGEDGPPPVLQAKLTINTPGDAHEAEADQVASNVLARKETSGQIGGSGSGSGSGGGNSGAQIQRKCASCGSEAQGDSPCPSCAAKAAALQRSAGSGAANTPSPTTSAAQAVANPGSGAPLAPATRAPIEAELGRDLSSVRVHSDSRAREAADSIDAKAFTHGQNIWLGSGQSADDMGLMAHEATHTVQQGKGGASGPALVQRAPADHRPTEDGTAPRARIDAELEKEKKAKGEPDPGDAPPKIDPAEKRAKAAPLESKAKPDADRPAQAGPMVAGAAQEVKAKADSPPEPLTQAKADAPKAEAASNEGGGEDPMASVQKAAALVTALPEPPQPQPMTPPPMVMPVDRDGLPLAPDLEGEALAQTVAVQLHGNRDAAFSLRQHAKQARANAALLRGNIGMADSHIATSEAGIKQTKADLKTRRGIIKEAENAHAVSKAKADKVAADAPPLQVKAEGAKDEVGPVASEAADTAAQQKANAPDDPDAGGAAQENSQKLGSVAQDTATMSQTTDQARAGAIQLQADANQAAQDNAAAMGKIEETKATADQLDSKLDQESATTAKAKSQLDAQRAKPDAVDAKAQNLESGAAAIDAASQARMIELQAIQADYIRDTAGVDGAQSLADENDGDIQRAPRGGGGYRGRGFFGISTAGAGRVSSRSRGGGKPPRASKGLKGQKPDPNQAYNDRWQVNIPQFDLMTDRQKQHRMQQAQAAAERRKARLKALQDGTYGDVAQMDSMDRMGLAMRFMMTEAYHSVMGVQWSDWSLGSAGQALMMAINPLGPINGVLAGLSTLAGGVANIGNVEQWKKDPLQNGLKIAADIATGITVILGSIVALLGLITALSAAAIVLSWFTLSPLLTPVILWCTSTGITVGSWTISAGKFALLFQELLIFKNLYDAATATTAKDLLQNSEQMSTDFSQAGQVGMQMATAHLAKVGGPGMLDNIGTNGVRAIAVQETRELALGAGLEYTFGADVAGRIGQARMAKGLYNSARGGGGGDGAAAPKPGGEDSGGGGAGGGGAATAPKTDGTGGKDPSGNGGAAPAAPAAPATPAPPPRPAADIPPPPSKAAPMANADMPTAPAGSKKPALVDAPEPSPKVDLGDAAAPAPSPAASKPQSDADASAKAKPKEDQSAASAAATTPAADGGKTAAPKLESPDAPAAPGPAPVAATGYKKGSEIALPTGPAKAASSGEAPGPKPGADAPSPASTPDAAAPSPAAKASADSSTPGSAKPAPAADAPTATKPSGDGQAPAPNRAKDAGDAPEPLPPATAVTKPTADGDAPKSREPDIGEPSSSGSPPRPDDPGQAALRQSAAKKPLAALSDGERVAEASQARAVPHEDVPTQALKAEGYTDLRKLDNNVDYVGNPKKGKFCRLIQRCGSADKTGDVPATGLKPDGDGGEQARVDAAAATNTKPPSTDAGAAAPARPASDDAGPATSSDAAPAPKPAADPDAAPAATTPAAKPAPNPKITGEALRDNIKQSLHDEPYNGTMKATLEQFGYTISEHSGGVRAERRGRTGDLPAIRIEDGRIKVDHYVKGSVNRTGLRINADGKMEAIVNLKAYRESPDTVAPIWRAVDDIVPPGGDPNHYNWIKGQLGEIRMDKIAAENGWIKISGPKNDDGTRQDADWLTPMPGANSIDAVYLNPSPPPGPYIVADAKMGSARQGKTKSNTVQMSMDWILPRLESAGLNASDLRKIENGYTPILVKINARGEYEIVVLNADGSKKSTITLKNGTTDRETPAKAQ